MLSSQYEKGLEVLEKIHGEGAGMDIVKDIASVSKEYADMVIEWCFGQVLSRPHLDLKTRELLILSTCITLGHTKEQIYAHTAAAMKLGASKEEIIELIIQMAMYVGFPVATNAMRIAKSVFDEKESGGSNV